MRKNLRHHDLQTITVVTLLIIGCVLIQHLTAYGDFAFMLFAILYSAYAYWLGLFKTLSGTLPVLLLCMVVLAFGGGSHYLTFGIVLSVAIFMYYRQRQQRQQQPIDISAISQSSMANLPSITLSGVILTNFIAFILLFYVPMVWLGIYGIVSAIKDTLVSEQMLNIGYMVLSSLPLGVALLCLLTVKNEQKKRTSTDFVPVSLQLSPQALTINNVEGITAMPWQDIADIHVRRRRNYGGNYRSRHLLITLRQDSTLQQQLSSPYVFEVDAINQDSAHIERILNSYRQKVLSN